MWWFTKKKVTKSPTQVAIEAFVDELFQKSDSFNATLLPDAVEKQIYIKLFCLLILNIKEICDGFKLELFDHEITISVTPKPPRDGSG